MLLHKVYLNLRCKEVRRDISDPYEMHSTLCRAFSGQDQKCLPGTFLWRLEPEANSNGMPKVLIQSHEMPNWSRIAILDWFAEEPSSPIHIKQKLDLTIENLSIGIRFRYRLRANPSVRREGKRLGLYKSEEQNEWLLRQGKERGFFPETIYRSQEQMLTGRRRSGESIRVFSVLYDGMLKVIDSTLFIETVTIGIGHGKAMGLGLLSIAPIVSAAG